jgi:hypothetical protein
MTLMSDVAQGPGWWQASDGRWYPPEAAPPEMATAAMGPLLGNPPYTGLQPNPAYGWNDPNGGYVAVYRNRTIGIFIILLGLAALLLGAAAVLHALAIRSVMAVPRDELISSWLVAGGWILAGLSAIVIGFLHRRN